MISNADFIVEKKKNKDLNPCKEINYCLTSYIQPFALLIMVDEILDIKKISANATMFAGLPKNLLEKNFLTLIEYSSHLTIFDAISELKVKNRNNHFYLRWNWNKNLLLTPQHAEGFLFYSGNFLCFEVILPATTASKMKVDYLSRKIRATHEIATYEGHLSDFAILLTKHIRMLTDFDRLYCLRFDSQGNGMVIGESSNGIYPSLMSHYFPSTDIPTNLHAVYCVNRFRHYPDRNYEPVVILEVNSINQPLDLSLSLSRQVGRSHLKYLENMGVEASVSFSVVVDGKLWGLIGGHNSTSKLLRLQQLLDIQNLVELFASKIHAITELNQRDQLTQRLNRVIELTHNFVQCHCDLNMFAQKNVEALKAMMQADGIIWVKGNEIGSNGISKSNILPLINFALTRTCHNGVFSTNSLSAQNSLFELCAKEASGMLALAFNRNELMVWLRVEQLQQKKWGGNPNTPIETDENGVLNPRNSFATWVELVRNTSLPWELLDFNVASEMCFAFTSVKLNQVLRLEPSL
ncbi:MAG: GAF domain-containing protein [Pseudomonadota bacterium]